MRATFLNTTIHPPNYTETHSPSIMANKCILKGINPKGNTPAGREPAAKLRTPHQLESRVGGREEKSTYLDNNARSNAAKQRAH